MSVEWAPEKIYITVANLHGKLDREPDSHVSFEEQPAWAKTHLGLPKYSGKGDFMIEEHQIHQAAKKGFEVGADAYERGRPEYPAQAVSRLVEELGLASGKSVIDLGAGTGKFTKLLAAATNAKVSAVEPVAGMRKKFSEILPQVAVLEGSAENIPVPSSSLDAVVAAQAFHWFDGEKTLREIHRVLKPGGKIGLIWNARDETTSWVRKLTDIIDPYEKGVPRYKSGNWEKAFTETSLFSPLKTAEFRYLHIGTPAMVVDRVASISFISALDSEQKAKVLDQVRAVLKTSPETLGKTQVEFPYRTDIFWCEKV